MKKIQMNEIVNHLKTFGFVYQGSEIYGGLSNTWDYGPLGTILKNNIVNTWKKEFILKEYNNVLLDTKILMNPNVWVTSGHVSNFSDPLIENKVNGKRYRADKLISEIDPKINAEKMSFEEMEKYLIENLHEYENSKVEWSKIKKFNLMFETQQGVVENNKSKIYLRPETAQGIFVNFKNVLRSTRSKLPIGIGQIGKSFRNEVTPGNFIFRTREFEQMELEIFCNPDSSNEVFEYYLKKFYDYVLKIGISEKSIRIRKHDPEELAHYSKATSDIEFNFPFGWGELLGVANRGDFDLSIHSKATGVSLDYLDPTTNVKFIPYVIEPSIGVDRLLLAIICEAFKIQEIRNEQNELVENRIYLQLNKELAPFKIAVLPLTKKLDLKSKEILNKLIDLDVSVTYDEVGSIGKRYRRQDAIGTFYCLTVDYETLNDNCVTLRNRDTMKQIRVKIEDLKNYI